MEIRSVLCRESVEIEGEYMLGDPEMKGDKIRKEYGRAASSVLEISRLIGEDGILHDGGELLTGQVLAARTMPGADGPRMVSTDRFDAGQTAVWVSTAARKRSVGRGSGLAM